MAAFLVVNEHPEERALRVLVGLGFLPLVTGLSGVCPLDSLFGFSTCRVPSRKAA